VEDALSSVSNVKKITSTASYEQARIGLELDFEADADLAAIEATKKVEAIKNRLPEEADSPVVIKRDLNAKPIVEHMPGRCPKCGAGMLKRKSKKGYAYYACETGAECGFMTWDVPTDQDCPVCGQTMFKRSGKGRMKPFCINEKCENFLPEDKRGYYKRPQAADAAEAAEGAENQEQGAGKTAGRKTAAKKTTAGKTAAKKTAAAKKTTTAKKPVAKKTTAKKTKKTEA
jgi:DNA topoisomerase-1